MNKDPMEDVQDKIVDKEDAQDKIVDKPEGDAIVDNDE